MAKKELTHEEARKANLHEINWNDPKIRNGVRKWVKSLRSGEFKQGKQALEGASGQYCCLGVLVKTQIKNPEMLDGRLAGAFPRNNLGVNEPWIMEINNWFVLERGITLSKLNDHQGKSFNEIADFIEEEFLNRKVKV